MLAGKSVLITGASSGLGSHFATLLAKNGVSRLYLAARRTGNLKQLKETLEQQIVTNTPKIMCIEMDINNIQSIKQAFQLIDIENAIPDILINNAGISIPKSFLEVTPKEYDETMNINLRGHYFVTQEIVKRMISKNIQNGTIINISSILGLRVGQDLSTYSISKAGMIQMTKACALELARYKIRVNCICPGYIKTEMNEGFFETEKGKEVIKKKMLAKRLGLPQELDGAILLLASDSSSFMTGSIITIDGGHIIGSL